jgi:hypothetical protein
MGVNDRLNKWKANANESQKGMEGIGDVVRCQEEKVVLAEKFCFYTVLSELERG